MGYTPGFEGPHPSQLPVYDPDAADQDGRCTHSGLSDSWRGDEVTRPGYVWSCLYRCGAPGSQMFYPDAEDGSNLLGWRGIRTPTEGDNLTSEQTARPTVGRVVHYVSHGTPIQPDGSRAYESACRAAIITEVSPESNAKGDNFVSLCVLNPSGLFFNQGVVQHEAPQTADEVPGGGPYNHPGGTWHWPERV